MRLPVLLAPDRNPPHPALRLPSVVPPPCLQVYVPVTFSRLHLTLMPRYGNPDLLVNVAGRPPSIRTFQYSSTAFIGTDMLDVDANSLAVRSACRRVSRPGATCPPIRVAVYGNDHAQFSLLASLDGRTLPLANGYPLILDGLPNVYTFFVFNASASLAIPSATATPSSTSTGSSTASATPSGSFNASGVVPSVAATATPSGTASPFPTSSPLRGGSPAPAFGTEVVFTLTALSGMPVIYVSSSSSGSTRPQEGASFCASYDTATTAGTNSGGSVVGRIVIRPGDPCYCGGLAVCSYFVGVGSEFDFTYYTVLASENALSAPAIAANASVARPLASTPITYLLDGLPQDATVNARGSQTYLFEFVPASASAPGSRAVATLSLAQYWGSVTLFASFVAGGFAGIPAGVAPGPAGFHYRATTVGGAATISISLTEPTYLAFCGSPGNATRVCVMAITIVASPASGYELTARTNRGLVLNDGNPTLATVATLPGATQYFRYTQTDPGDVIISAVPISGAVDVYVGSSAFPGTSRPGPGSNASYVWRAVGSAAGRTQAVVILQDDPRSLACAIPCAYSIAVVPAPSVLSGSASADGTIPSSLAFTVMARTRTVAAVPLLDGQPLIDYVAPFDYDFYRASIPADADSLSVTVSLDPSGGGGALAGPQSVRLFARVDGQLPDPTFAQFSSPLLRVTGADATLTIRRDNPAVLAACRPDVTVTPVFDANGTVIGNSSASSPRACSVDILATSDTGAVFTLTSVAGSRVLQDGAAITATVPVGQTLYFTYVAASGSSHVQLTLTALAGSPVGFVSSVEQRPNASTAAYRVGSIYGNTLTLAAPEGGCGSDGSDGLCAFYVGVTSLYPGSSAVFRLQGTSSSLAGLSLGSPASGKASPDSYTYYSLYVPADVTPAGGISFALSALDGGWMTAFVSNAIDGASGQTIVPAPVCATPAAGSGRNATRAAGCDFLRPTNGTFGWAARPANPYRTSLRLASTEPGWVGGTTYVIAVTAAVPDTDFTITTVAAGQPLTLSSGTPTTDILDAGIPGASALFYRLLVPTGAVAMTLQGMPVDGDVAVYASLNTTTPGPSNAEYAATIFQSHRIDIGADALSACILDEYSGLCSVFVGVTFPLGQPIPSWPVTFSLVSTSVGATVAPTRLLPGAVQVGALPEGAWAYYYVNVNVTAGQPWYVNHVQLTGSAAVYVSTDGTLPTPSNFAATASSLLGVTFLSLRPENPRYISSGPAIVGVQALSACSYTLSQGSAALVEDLPQGFPLQGRLDAGQYSYYSLSVGANPGDVQLGLTALSGSPLLYASQWARPAANLAFRPSKEDYQFAGLGTNALTVNPSDASFCARCTYIIAVYCDPTVPGGAGGASATAPRCSFLLSGTTGNGALTRLIGGVPVRSRAPAGKPRYFFLGAPAGPANVTLVAGESTGSAGLLLADSYAPSGASPGLPVPGNRSTFAASSVLGVPTLSYLQRDAPVPAGATRLHIYTVGVASVGTGAAVFNLRASTTLAGSRSGSGNPVLLLPGQPASNNVLSGVGSVQYFAVDIADVTRDAVLSLSLRYGSATLLVGSRGSTPACARNATGGLNCTGVMWALPSSSSGNVRLRISARAPCANAVSPAACVGPLDWAVSTYLIAVVSGSPEAAFSLTSFSASGLLMVEDGQPLDVVQASDAEPQVLLYSINGDPALPDVRLSWDVDASSAAFRWYLTSCVDGSCTPALMFPSPVSAEASGVLDAGRRADVVISARPGSAYAAAYCRANSTDAVCRYYLVAVPVAEDCTARRLSPCVASFQLVASFQGSLAPILRDAGSLAGKVTVLANSIVPQRDQLYYLYVSPRDSDSSPVSLPPSQQVVLRMDACDTLLGYPQAYLCEETGTPGARANTTCADPIRPDYRSGNFGYVLNTRPETVGGDGRARLTLPTRSRTLYVSVANPDIRASAWERKARFLPATYELSVTVGDAVRLRPATNESVGALWTSQNANATELTIRWLPPLVANVPQDAALPSSLANISSALNVTYRVYIARGGFQAFVSKVTNTSNLFTGVLPSTACGLDRYASLVARNASVYSTSGTSLKVRGLKVGEYYELNVVAVCNDDCLRANAARLGMPIPPSGLDTARLPYALLGGVLLVAPSSTPLPMSELDSSASSLGSLGLVAVAGLAVLACIVSSRHRKRAKAADAAVAVMMSPRTGLAPAAAAAASADGLVVPRTPALRRALGASGDGSSAATAAGGALPPAAVEAASYNQYAALASRFGAEPGGSSGSGSDVTAVGISGGDVGELGVAVAPAPADAWAVQGTAAPGTAVADSSSGASGSAPESAGGVWP